MSSPSSDDAVDYSLIVPAYNEAEQLPRTLPGMVAAMRAVTAFRGELIVTDNNSSDNTAEIARGLGARVVFEPVNQIARARNTGARAARGPYLVFVDADTVLGADLLSAALETLQGGAICGGGSRVGTSDDIPFGARLALRFWNRLAGLVRWAAGSFVFCLRQAWQDTGGFDERFYASEEIHFSRALKRWGRKRSMGFVILPQSVDTSMRKVYWYSRGQLAGRFMKLVFCPWHLKSRKGCDLWYGRPADKSKPHSEEDAP